MALRRRDWTSITPRLGGLNECYGGRVSTVTPASDLLKQKRANRLEDNTVAPILSIGFRLFFLLATVSAVVLVPAWLWVLERGNISPYWAGTTWHAHEMLFGFTVAVIAGFLLTAASNWSQRITASGRLLVILGVLWVAGRLAPLLPVPPLLVAAIDLSFLPVLVAVLARALVPARSRRNYGLLALLGLLFVTNLLMHVEQLAMHDWQLPFAPEAGTGQRLSLRLVAAIILVVGGRVIPMFTRNATGDLRIQSVASLDWAALAAFAVAVVAETLFLGQSGPAVLWMFAGALHLARMSTWGSLRARAPLLWILHVGYAATAASFVLEGLALLGYIAPTSALHLFTVGGIGGLTLGMMARVSLGHSGRQLAVPRYMGIAFALVTAAAVVRALFPLLLDVRVETWWTISGVLWTLAFVLLLAFGFPIWISPRADHNDRSSA